MINKKLNIFEFATRELSQDAIICWIFDCLHSDESQYLNIGCEFIRFLFNDSSIKNEDIELSPSSPHNQYYHMDVYSELRIKNTVYPIIFENKTNTYLHGEQFSEYINNVNEWITEKGKDKYLSDLDFSVNSKNLNWGAIHYFYYKTGFISEWERKDFINQASSISNSIPNVNISTVTAKSFLEFLNKQNCTDILLSYKEYLSNLCERQDYSLENYLTTDDVSLYSALSEKAGCVSFMQDIFRDLSDKVYINYNHQNWASFDIIKNENEICYTFRLDKRKNEKHYEYAIIFQQYRYEKEGKHDFESKVDEFNYMLEKCSTICESINPSIKINFSTVKSYDKVYSAGELFRIFINSANTPNNVIDFIKLFTKKFLDDSIKGK